MKNKINPYWQKFFNQLAADSDDPIKTAAWTEAGFQIRYKYIQGVLLELDKPKGFKLLDGGCGVGHYLELAENFGAHSIGLDFSMSMLTHVKKEGFLCCLGDIENIPFKIGTFDLALSVGTLQHLEEADQCIGQFAQILKTDGILILVTLSKHSLRAKLCRLFGKSDKMSYSLNELSMILQNNGFIIRKSKYLYIFPSRFNFLASLFNHNRVLNHILYPFANAICLVSEK